MRRDRQVTAPQVPLRARRLSRALAVGLLAPPFLLLGASAVLGAPREGVDPVTKWRAFPSTASVTDGLIAIDAKGRTAFVFSAGAAGAAFTVRAWDIDRLTPRGPAITGPSGTQVKADTAYAVDEVTHTVYVLPPAGTGGTQRLVAVGLRAGAAKVVGTLAPRFTAGYKTMGLAVSSAHNRLFLLAAPDANAGFVQPATGLLQVDVWKAAAAAEARVAPEVDPPVPVPPACGQPITYKFPPALLPSADGTTLTMGCLGTRGAVGNLVGPPHEISGIARFQVISAAATKPFTVYPMYGSFQTGDSYTQPGANWFALSSTGGTQTNLKVFNTDTNRWVGNVAYDGALYAVAGDVVNHRGYLVVTGGFGSVEMDGVPVTQLRLVPSMAALLGPLQRSIAVDPKTHRIFIPSSDDVVNGPNSFIYVIKDSRPRYDASFADDPDGDSLKTREVPGKIDSARVAYANASGAELRWVGGTNGPCANPVRLDPKRICDPGTRYYELAVSRNVNLSNEQSTAEAVTVRVDATTQGETAKATGVGEEPPAPPVLCQDFEGKPDEKSGDNVSAKCDSTKQLVSAESAASPPRMLLAARAEDPLPAAVQVRSATSQARTERLPDGTTKSTATATAHGVDILGVVQIGTVTATAVTETHGQPGTAKATYTSAMRDVTINGQEVCQAACKFGDVAAQINDVLDGRVRVTFTDPKKVAFASPGGVTARIAVEKYEHAEDQMVNDVPADSVLTAALNVTVYDDGAAAQRQLARLALVSLSQQYRVVSVDNPVDFPTFEPQPPGPPAPVAPGGTTIVRPGTTGTGGTGTGDTPPATLAGPNQGGVFGSIINGLRVVFRSPGQVAGIACVWLLMATPAYLAARRRLLLELPRLRAQEDV